MSFFSGFRVWLILLTFMAFDVVGSELLVVEQATLLTPAGSRVVALPYVLDEADFPAAGGRVRFRLEVTLPTAPANPLGVYVPKLSLSGSLSLNGVGAGSCGQGVLEELRCLHQPQLFMPPAGLWRPGLNTLEFEIFANDRQMNGLTPVHVGPVSAVYEALYLPRWLWQVGLLRWMTWLAVCLGLLGLVVGKLLRADRLYLWFGVGAIVNALSNMNVLVTVPPVSTEVFSWFVFSSRMVSTPLGIGMLLAFFRHLGPRAERALLLAAVVMPVLVWVSGSNRTVVTVVYVPMLGLMLWVALASVRWARDSGQRLDAIVSGLTLGLMAISIHDWLRLRGDTAFEGVYGITYAFTGFMLVFGVLLLARLTEALLAERRLTDMLRLATQSARGGFWEWNLTTQKIFWSPEMWALFGFDPTTPEAPEVWSAWRSRVHPEDLPEAERIALAAARDLKPLTLDYRITLPDGRLRWIETRADIHADAQGKRGLLAGICLDVTDRKVAEVELTRSRDRLEERVAERTAELEDMTRQLAAKEQAKRVFLANMSHEIRTPMTGILGMIELALSNSPADAQRNYLKKMEHSAQSLLTILNDILDFSKIEAGKLRIERAPLQLSSLLENLRHLMKPAAKAKALEFKVELGEGLDGYFLCDSLRLRQVLANLLGNAIKFTDRGSVVMRASRAGSDRLLFEVCDTGIGLTLEQRQRLFSAFSQADNRISRRYGGTGLGLAISQQLVELMGGRIEVDSEPDHGSCFFFEIEASPCASPITPTPRASEVEEPFSSLRGCRVLLAEDNPVNREFVQSTLERYGVLVEVAENGLEACERFEATSPALVIMDVQMPIMDGYEATRRIRAVNQNVPIIALSANAYQEDIRQSLAAGMNEHVSKPVNTARLLNLLVNHLHPLPPALPEIAGLLPDPVMNDWTMIDGIDRAHAFQIMDGQWPMFLRLFRLFVNQHAEFMSRTRELLATGERLEAARAMHNLIGAAGQIGALEVRAAAIAAKKGMEDNVSDLEALLLQVENPLDRLQEAARTFFADIDQKPVPQRHS